MRRTVSTAVALLTATALLAAPGAAREPAVPPLEPPGQVATTTVPRGWPDAPPVSAASYLLVDTATGQVLAEHEADLRRPVASTIKILTALTALRRAPADEVVTVGREIEGIGGASVGLRVGDRLTVEQLIEAVIARSGNDASVALATHVGGSVDGFLALMRAEASDLGLDGVAIATPSGLNDDNLLSARDLVVITRAALEQPAFRAIAGRATVTLPRVGTVPSRNELLDSYPGATGVKTGFTAVSGYSLVASATRDGRDLIAVVLKAPTTDARFRDAAALLDHGFEAFVPAVVAAAARLRVAGGWVPARADVPPVLVPAADPTTEVEVRLPIEPGGTGQVDVTWNDALLSGAQLVAAAEGRGPDRPEGGAAVGRWLWDRAYAALRAGVPGSA